MTCSFGLLAPPSSYSCGFPNWISFVAAGCFTVTRNRVPGPMWISNSPTHRNSHTASMVFGGDTHAEGKLASIFEPTTEIIRRRKAGKPTEFGKILHWSARRYAPRATPTP